MAGTSMVGLTPSFMTARAIYAAAWILPGGPCIMCGIALAVKLLILVAKAAWWNIAMMRQADLSRQRATPIGLQASLVL